MRSINSKRCEFMMRFLVIGHFDVLLLLSGGQVERRRRETDHRRQHGDRAKYWSVNLSIILLIASFCAFAPTTRNFLFLVYLCAETLRIR